MLLHMRYGILGICQDVVFGVVVCAIGGMPRHMGVEASIVGPFVVDGAGVEFPGALAAKGALDLMVGHACLLAHECDLARRAAARSGDSYVQNRR
jgi:hypothetical protein